MREWLILMLLRLVRWLDITHAVVMVYVPKTHLDAAKDVTSRMQDRFGERMGSAKRRDALALLMKPPYGLSESDAALAIELVLR